jgi:hypothetical protein
MDGQTDGHNSRILQIRERTQKHNVMKYTAFGRGGGLPKPVQRGLKMQELPLWPEYIKYVCWDPSPLASENTEWPKLSGVIFVPLKLFNSLY